MSRFSRTYITASISATLLASFAQAEETSKKSEQLSPPTDQCSVDTAQNASSNQEPVNIEADSLEAIEGQRATYKGNVVVVQGNRTITADSVTLLQAENIVTAQGNVTLNDGQLKASSSKITNDLNTNEVTLADTQYQFLCQQGRGEAAYISKTDRAIYQIEDGSFTTCPEGDNSWRFLADDIRINEEKEVAYLYGSRVEIKDVPVFYMPYLSLPTSDKRKTGLLYPSISLGSKNGLELTAPIYWNLAENYDLLTTIHYMQNRGTQFQGNFRYLTQHNRGSLATEYLATDDKYPDKQNRWAFQYKNNTHFGEHWRFGLDYSRVSDNDYFRDINSSIGSRADGQLLHKGTATYREQYWDATLTVQDYQILVDSGQPYRLMPRLDFNYYRPELYQQLNFDMVSHIARFDTDDTEKPSATRLHIEPGLTLPLSNTWGTWTTEARYLVTYYQQDLDGQIVGNGTELGPLEENVTRAIPEFRSHVGMVLERDTSFIDGYTQTLEPQAQYVYVPEHEQANINSYDTTLLQTDYQGLFRSRRFSSIDQVASANQVSYGASSRFFDAQQKERLAISFGQIYYLGSNPNNDSSNYSSWAMETDFNYNDHISYHGSVQYDIDFSEMSLANSAIEYRDQGNFIQANYRFVNINYIDAIDQINPIASDLSALTRDGINQVGLIGGYKINRNWLTSGQYYYDLTENVPIEWSAKLEYISDCWYLAVDYSRQLRGWLSGDVGVGEANFEDNINLNFGIIGLGGSSKGPTLPDGSALTYGRPFTLDN